VMTTSAKASRREIDSAGASRLSSADATDNMAKTALPGCDPHFSPAHGPPS
jgi:hypothetical protein